MAVDDASSKWSVTIIAAGQYTLHSSFNFYSGQSTLPQLKASFGLEIFCLCVGVIKIATCFYSLSPGFWQSFISIEVCRDCIPALASSCKK